MATVEDIYRRLAAEDTQAPWLTRAQREDPDWGPPLDDAVSEPPSLKPNRKVVVGAVTAFLTTVAVWGSEKYLGTELSPEMATSLTGVLSLVVSYLVPER